MGKRASKMGAAAHALGNFVPAGPGAVAIPVHAAGVVQLGAERWHYFRGPHWVCAGNRRIVSGDYPADKEPHAAVVQAYLSRTEAMKCAEPERQLQGSALVSLVKEACGVTGGHPFPALVEGSVFDLVALGTSTPFVSPSERLWLTVEGDTLLVRGPRLRLVLMRMSEDTEPEVELWPEGQ